MYDNYDDACAARINRARALREVLAHGCDVSEFLADVGDKESYTGKEILDWLGY